MAKNNEEVVEKYPDGTPIVRFPRWVYPGGKPAHKTDHRGVLVHNQKELDAALASFGGEEAPKPSGETKNIWK